MAKKPTGLNDLFTSTLGKVAQVQSGDNADLDEGRIQTVGIGIRLGETSAIDEIAKKHGISRNALMRLAIRKFILEVRAGEFDPGKYIETPEQKHKVVLPE